MNWLMTILMAFFSMKMTIYAQEFTFQHSDCRIRMKAAQSPRLKQAKELLEKKDFKVLELIEGKRTFPDELYFKLQIDRPKEKLYSACIVTIKILKAKGNIPKESDMVIFKKSIKRTVPRITFKGEERCRMALDDAFIHIPYCRQ